MNMGKKREKTSDSGKKKKSFEKTIAPFAGKRGCEGGDLDICCANQRPCALEYWGETAGALIYASSLSTGGVNRDPPVFFLAQGLQDS